MVKRTICHLLNLHNLNKFYLPVFFTLVIILVACAPFPLTSTEGTVQPALPTPTLEPTFTPSPFSTSTSIPTPTDTPTPELTLTPVSQAGVSGRIFDQNTNQPLAEAEVSVGDWTTTTNDNGRYNLTGLEPGQYILSVTQPDYDPGLSKIFTLVGGQDLFQDLALYAPETSPYPEDPMRNNPLDPNGALTEADAIRLAQEQGLTNNVVSVKETTLTGEYLVNYKIGDEVRAAVAQINHDVWELTDETGRKWWIIKVCGNLASPVPARKPLPTPKPISLPPMAEVLTDELIVRECASEDCGEVGSVPGGERVEVFGCLAHKTGGWCEVGWSGVRGWCTGESLRQLAVVEAVPMVEIVVPTVTPGVVASGEGKIVFESGRDHIEQIYVINLDGSGITRLTNHERHDQKPVWSPDGRRIAFQSSSNLNFEIYVMNADGSNLTQLTNNPLQDWMPVWSPDSQQIAFWSERKRRNNFSIYLINADGSGLRRLIEDDCDDNLYYCDGGMNPTWSPDSRKISLEYQNDIYVVNTDGTGLKALTNDKEAILDYNPAWSPDGQKIAFNCYLDEKNEICVMNADGSGKTNLTNHSASDTGPIWSPDSRKIAFTSDRDGNQEIYVMNADGSDLARLTNNPHLSSDHPGLDYGPTWSPDSQQIAFVSWSSDHFGHSIYIVNVDGSGLVRLTDYINDNWPNWSP